MLDEATLANLQAADILLQELQPKARWDMSWASIGIRYLIVCIDGMCCVWMVNEYMNTYFCGSVVCLSLNVCLPACLILLSVDYV